MAQAKTTHLLNYDRWTVYCQGKLGDYLDWLRYLSWGDNGEGLDSDIARAYNGKR